MIQFNFCIEFPIFNMFNALYLPSKYLQCSACYLLYASSFMSFFRHSSRLRNVMKGISLSHCMRKTTVWSRRMTFKKAYFFFRKKNRPILLLVLGSGHPTSMPQNWSAVKLYSSVTSRSSAFLQRRRKKVSET